MKKAIIIITILSMCLIFTKSTFIYKADNILEQNKEVTNLIWYQIGKKPNDLELVLDEMNTYLSNKIDANLEIRYFDWSEYNERMNIVLNSAEIYDMAFTSSWANSFLENVQKGNFIKLDYLIDEFGKEMLVQIDQRFWEGVKINNSIYGVPTQKEICLMPMWVFTKEIVDKYNIPYQDIHSLEDLEKWLELVKKNEPEVIPFYINQDYSIPNNFDQIVDAVGIFYNDNELKVQNFYETEEAFKNFKIMHYYYQKGYVNKDAAITTSSSDIKRFVFKADGQPYAENIWSKDLGYDVVASNISEPIVTNNSIQGAITSISKTSKNAKKSIQFLNLANTNKYLRNLLNFGLENIHYKKLNDTNIRLLDKSKDYQVPYFVQGNLFNTYLLENEPSTKWNEFKIFNDSAKNSCALDFNFDSKEVINDIANIRIILDTFGASINTGTVDPDIFLPKLNQELKKAGIERIISQIQLQIDEWKEK